jgi:hypothetical protein
LFGHTEPPLFSGDHVSDIGKQLLGIVDNAVFHRVADTADAIEFLRLLIQPQRAGAIERLEILSGFSFTITRSASLPTRTMPIGGSTSPLAS